MAKMHTALMADGARVESQRHQRKCDQNCIHMPDDGSHELVTESSEVCGELSLTPAMESDDRCLPDMLTASQDPSPGTTVSQSEERPDVHE